MDEPIPALRVTLLLPASSVVSYELSYALFAAQPRFNAPELVLLLATPDLWKSYELFVTAEEVAGTPPPTTPVEFCIMAKAEADCC